MEKHHFSRLLLNLIYFLNFQAKFSEFGRLIDVHDTGNGFAFVTYNHKKASGYSLHFLNS